MSITVNPTDFINLDKKAALKYIIRDGQTLKYMNPIFRSDRDIALAAIKQNIKTFHMISDALQCDKEFLLSVVKCGVNVIPFTNYLIRHDRDIVLEMIKRDMDLYGLFNLSMYVDDYKFIRWLIFKTERVKLSVGGKWVKYYKFLVDENVAKKYFNVFKYGNKINFRLIHPDIRIITG